MEHKKNPFIQAYLKAYRLLHWNEFKYPKPIKGRYGMSGNKLEKMKWAYRCWVRQTEIAEQDSGIEAFFAGQDLRFTLPEGFISKAALSLSAGGDLMAVDIITPENTPHLFDDIRDFYLDADITCANLESTVFEGAPIGRNSRSVSEAARMNTSEAMLDRFLDDGTGINYFSTANNHSYDYGEDGLLATLDVLDKKACCYSGTNRTPEQQEDVLIVEKNGIKIAFLSYTFDLNGWQCDKKYLVNEVRFNDESVDISLIQRHIKKAKDKEADLIIASCHWGWEFEMYPHKAIIEVAHLLADEGVDVILGGHPHVSQPMERYESDRGTSKRQCLIIYSLGNFATYQPLSRNSKLTYAVRLQIDKGVLSGVNQTYVSGLKVLPIYIQAGEKGDGTCDFRLVRFAKLLANPNQYLLTNEERSDLPRLEKNILQGIILPSNWAEQNLI